MGYKIVIPVIAIVAVLFTSGLAFDAFADHNNHDTPGSSGFFYLCTGKGNGQSTWSDWGPTIRANNGATHLCSMNWISGTVDNFVHPSDRFALGSTLAPVPDFDASIAMAKEVVRVPDRPDNWISDNTYEVQDKQQAGDKTFVSKFGFGELWVCLDKDRKDNGDCKDDDAVRTKVSVGTAGTDFPYGMALDPTKTIVYVAVASVGNGDSFQAFRVSDNFRLAKVTFKDSNGNTECDEPKDVAELNGNIVVTCQNQDRVYVMESGTLARKGLIGVGDGPETIEVDAVRNNLYVFSEGDRKFTTIKSLPGGAIGKTATIDKHEGCSGDYASEFIVDTFMDTTDCTLKWGNFVYFAGGNSIRFLFWDVPDQYFQANPPGWETIKNQFYNLFHNLGEFTGTNPTDVPVPNLDNNNTKLIFVSSSYGGGAGVGVNKDSRNSDITFDSLILLDPVGLESKRSTILGDKIGPWNAHYVQAWLQNDDIPPGRPPGGDDFLNVGFVNPSPFTTIYDEREPRCDKRLNDKSQSFTCHPKWGEAHGIIYGNHKLILNDPFFSNLNKMNMKPDLAVPNVVTVNEGEVSKINAKATDCASYWETRDYLKKNNFANPLTWFEISSQQRHDIFNGFNDPSGIDLEMSLFFHLVNSTKNGLEGNNDISLSTTLQVTSLEEIDNCKVKLPGINLDAKQSSPCSLPKAPDGGESMNCEQPHAFYAGATNYQQTFIYEQTREVTGPFYDDGPFMENKTMQVEDNGFPCNNCITDPNALGSKGWYDFQNFTINVLNVPPTVNSISEPMFNKLDATIIVRTTDPSMADTKAGFDYTIDWDDDSESKSHENAIVSFSHTYAQSGIYQVKVNATDKDGDWNVTSFNATTPFTGLSGLIDELVDEGPLKEGQGKSFTQKFNAIIRQIDKDNLKPTCKIADASIIEANAFLKSGKLTEQQGNDLISAIEYNKDQIGCNGNVIIVEKQTIGDTDPPTKFEFTGDVNGTISDDQQIILRDVSVGEYSSTETEKDFLEHIICSDSNSSGVVSSGTATFRVEDGDNAIKCVFVNEIPVAENSQVQVQKFFRNDSVSTSSNTAINQARTFSIPNNSNPSSPQTSDDLTDDKKGGGGDEHLTRPTFGVSHETYETIVDSGFRFNDQSFTINDNHHTPFAQQTVNIGEVNTFEAKIYADKRLKVQEFLFGIPNVGDAHLAELGVEVWYDYNGEIEEVKAIQKSNVIDKETIVATHEKTKCQSSDIEQKCDTTNVSMVFLEPLKDKVMAVKAIDYKGRYQITYLNEGVEIAGESLNPMQTYLIPSNVRDGGLIKVTQLEKYSPYWQSDDGRTFEMNSFDSFKEINITFERFQDTGTAYTRLHSGFGGVMAYELKRATEIFDASELISELPDFIPYTPPIISERMTDDMKAKMLEQEEIAKNIIEESKVQARW